MKKFEIKPTVVFGNNSISCLRTLSHKRFFVMADSFLVKNKMIASVTDELGGRDYMIYSDIIPDPPLQSVAKAIGKLREYKPDCVIAVGGGSCIDTAKAVIYYGSNEKIPFVAIPTTSGTGSEVTAFSVITDGDKGIKYPIVDDRMLPDLAILENSFVKTLPPSIIADTGMDVLVHSIEAFVSTASNEFSDAMAQKAICLVWENLLKSFKGDFTARDKMHKASLMAGLAFNNASLGINHAIAHNLGAKFKIPHGRVNALILPHVIECNSCVKSFTCTDIHPCAEKYAKIAKMLGFEGNNTKILVRKLINEFKKLSEKLGLPCDLSDCKVEMLYDDAVSIAEGALKDRCINTNPRKVSKEEIVEILMNLR